MECRWILCRATQQPKTLLKLWNNKNTLKTIQENNRNATKLWKKCDDSCLAAATVWGAHSDYTRQWAPAGTMHCAGPFRPTLLLYCTHRCCITVLNTQVLYHCTAHICAIPVYLTHRCCTPVIHTWLLYHCIANTGAVQVSENAKNKWVTNMTPPEKTSLKSATPSLNKVLDYSTLRGW